jgi:hypothetical protein
MIQNPLFRKATKEQFNPLYVDKSSSEMALDEY